MTPEHDFAARRIGRIVAGKWTLERLLGIGGMAAVYAARDSHGTLAAVKILHPEMSLREDVRERFLREGTAANRVGHPGAVRVLEDGSDGDGSAYLVMELLIGESLSERVRRLGTLPVAELLDYLDQILDVLIAAHERGIIHRDLKPDNMFVAQDGRIKILDFGLARLAGGGPGSFQTKTGLALGTLPYMAPEQALGRRAEIDGRADLFAVGATAFRILAGRKVHEGDSEAELLIAMASRPAPALASVAPHLPAEVCAVIDLSLAFSRDARYPDARAMQLDVRAARDGRPPPYAMRLTTVRDEATRADRPAAVLPAAAAIGGAAASAANGRAAPLALSSPTLSSDRSHVSATSASSLGAQLPDAPQSARAPAARKRVALVLGLAVLALIALAAGAGVLALVMISRDTRADALVPEGLSDGAVAAEAGSVATPAVAAVDEPAAPPSEKPSAAADATPTPETRELSARSRPKSSASASGGDPKPAAASLAASAAAARPTPASAAATPAPPPKTPAAVSPKPEAPPSESSPKKGKNKGKGRDRDKGD